MTDHAGQITSYGYDAVGNRASITYPNGNITEYSYDSLNRLTNLVHKDAEGNVLSGYAYDLHATGRREKITEESGRVTDYSYDNLYRLTDEVITDAVNGDYSANYQYDLVGNRTYETVDGVQTAYSYDLNDRLLSQGGYTYTYDNQGNTLTQTIDGQITQYIYNSQHEMVGVINPDLSMLSYEYNVNGIRVAQSEGGVTTEYVVDENTDYAQVLVESDGGADTVYTFGDDLISLGRDTDFRFYLYDGLGSTRALSDASGAVTDTYDYEAFGEVLASTGATENNFRFTGEQYDSSIDQYYLRARYYSPSSGRFTQMDTWMGRDFEPATLHKYSYVHADPSNWVDPTGLYTQRFGYAVEAEVEEQYKVLYPYCVPQKAIQRNCLFGGRAYYSPTKYLKPDIMNFIDKSFNEIKPLSPSGISGGIVQIKAYSAIYSSAPFFMLPKDDWTPHPAVVDGTPTFFVNIDGLIFYTDDRRLHREAAAATLATVAMIARNSASKVGTRLGGGAAARAGVNILTRMSLVYRAMLPPALGLQRF